MEMSDQTFTVFRHHANNPASISDDKVISIYQDFSGILWFGTHKVGVNKLTPYTSLFNYYHRDPETSPTLSDNFITTIYKINFT